MIMAVEKHQVYKPRDATYWQLVLKIHAETDWSDPKNERLLNLHRQAQSSNQRTCDGGTWNGESSADQQERYWNGDSTIQDI